MQNETDTLFPLPEPRRSGRAELSGVIKRARDIMRKDAGLNGDLDRIPQFSWLLFLKALDAREDDREITEGPGHRPLIDAPYRWQDWAAAPDRKRRVTGQPLQDFVNGELLPYLRERTGSDELDVIGTIFRDVQHRMLSGHLLREVVDKIDEIDFHAPGDVHTMAHIYESMLQEMRDTAGDAGEFYTPRPVIRFMVRMIDPRPGDVVLDPACGTGGFLVEAYEHVRSQNRGRLSSAQVRQLEDDLRGVDKKPLPYLLGTMNLLLHGIDRPRLVHDNVLAHNVSEHRRDRVDVILTNPPFGGEEESTIPKNFPTETRTAKTEWLFMQVAIERLRSGGRCAIVVPNNILFDGGVGAKVKRDLLSKCDLHTVVRLPNGVFAPYTLIPANLLFFEKTGPTRFTWFYELPLPEGRRNFTKTKPLQDEELAPVEAWWGGSERRDRVEGPHAWRVPIDDLIENGFNLDLRNPRGGDELAHRPPAELLAELIAGEREILALLEAMRAELGDGKAATATMRDLMSLEVDVVPVEPNEEYRSAGVYSFGRGLFDRGKIRGADTSYRRLHRLHAGQVVLSRLFAFEGAVAVVPPEFDGWVLSPEFPTFSPQHDVVHPDYLAMLCQWRGLVSLLQKASKGMGVRRTRVNANAFLAIPVPLPDYERQRRLGSLYVKARTIRQLDERRRTLLDRLTASALDHAFAGLA
jgi:type I restriction enzyme M protein